MESQGIFHSHYTIQRSFVLSLLIAMFAEDVTVSKDKREKREVTLYLGDSLPLSQRSSKLFQIE